ncbi:MAG TPA: hypothetical protein VMC62_06260 [Longilinea sp.]|nr:hypothetical protein [Longilinea sp.]
MSEKRVIDWLLDGDPSIRWQVLRDLANASEEEIVREQAKVATQSWGARLLSYQDPNGRWGGQLYTNKWLSTTYTLLQLRQMGLEPGNPQALRGCKELLEGGYRPDGSVSYAKTLDKVDNAVAGMILALLAYFDYPDGRIHAVAGYLIDQQLPDGRWEPVTGNTQLNYTLAGTLRVLDGLHEYEKRFPQQAGQAIEAQKRGREFLLKHHLYKDTQTDQPIDKKMLLFSFPPRWFYDVLTALDYFQDCRAGRDGRLQDAIDLVKARRNPDGTWNLQHKHLGKTFFEMEEVGKPSRWNTLRALRVLKWWEAK